MKRIHWLRTAFSLAAVAWSAVLPVAAWQANPSTQGQFRTAAALVYAAGAVVCHQRPERSFHLGTQPWPVCARCTGIYFAAAIMTIAAALISRRREAMVSARADAGRFARVLASPAGVRWLAACAVIPTVFTLVWEWTTGNAPSNTVRAAAGLPIGALVSWLLWRDEDEGRRKLGRAGHSE